MLQIARAAAKLGIEKVRVTGGEPLAQRECLDLLRALCDAGYEVSLETSGALDVSEVDPRVSKVMDLKTPGSGEVGRNRYDNIEHLRSGDQVKFVICDREDYDWARQMLQQHDIASRCTVLFSPVHGQQDAIKQIKLVGEIEFLDLVNHLSDDLVIAVVRIDGALDQGCIMQVGRIVQGDHDRRHLVDVPGALVAHGRLPPDAVVVLGAITDDVGNDQCGIDRLDASDYRLP